MVTYKRDPIPANQTNKRPGTKIKPTTITIHSTGVHDAPAKNFRAYLGRADNVNKVSFHVVIDEIEAIECIPLDEAAWHAGNMAGNLSSVGVEICENGNREKTLTAAAQVVAMLLLRLGLVPADLRQHYDWNGKNCPSILRNTKRWPEFCAKVTAEYERQKDTIKVSVLHNGSELCGGTLDGGTTTAPLRAVAEACGATVGWNGDMRIAEIVTKK